MPGYHDVIVYVGDAAHCIGDSYDYELTCSRARGWSLWRSVDGGKTWALLGGEFEHGRFRIEVAGHVICDSGRSAAGGVAEAL